MRYAGGASRSLRRPKGRRPWGFVVVAALFLLIILLLLRHSAREATHELRHSFVLRAPEVNSVEFVWNKAFILGADLVNTNPALSSSRESAGADVRTASSSPRELVFSEGYAGISDQFAADFEHAMAEASATAPPLVVYMTTVAVPNFFQRCVFSLPETTVREFVLVSGCVDASPSDAFLGRSSWWRGSSIGGVAGGRQLLDAALQHRNLRRWFAQNCDVDHPKVVCLPIGVDFHSRSLKSVDGEPVQSVGEQYAVFQQEVSAAHERSPSRREMIALVDFAFNTNWVLRSAVYSQLFFSSGVVSSSSTTRNLLWAKYGQVTFVISPPGNGYDCHRTWEALGLGAIPILLRSEEFLGTAKGNELFDELPVVLVESYAEVTLEALVRWAREIQKRRERGAYNLARLRNDYWIRKFRQ